MILSYPVEAAAVGRRPRKKRCPGIFLGNLFSQIFISEAIAITEAPAGSGKYRHRRERVMDKSPRREFRRHPANKPNRAIETLTITTANMSFPLCSIGLRQRQTA